MANPLISTMLILTSVLPDPRQRAPAMCPLGLTHLHPHRGPLTHPLGHGHEPHSHPPIRGHGSGEQGLAVRTERRIPVPLTHPRTRNALLLG